LDLSFQREEQHYGTERRSNSKYGILYNNVDTKSLIENTPLEKTALVSTWTDYYKLRNIPFTSPVALLLHYPLTVYYILSNILSKRISVNPGSKITIHYLGPHRELAQLPLFKEILCILPGIELDMVFIGLDIPNEMKQPISWKVGTGVLNIKFDRNYYEKVFDTYGAPDVIIGLNAGLAAISTWHPTQELITEKKIPGFASNFIEMTLLLSKLISRTLLKTGVKLLSRILRKFGVPRSH
jgi:hypothetical protein